MLLTCQRCPGNLGIAERVDLYAAADNGADVQLTYAERIVCGECPIYPGGCTRRLGVDFRVLRGSSGSLLKPEDMGLGAKAERHRKTSVRTGLAGVPVG